MPIFNAFLRAGAAALLLALGACSDTVTLSDDLVRVRVAETEITLAAPAGFCFDERVTDVNSAGAFLLAGDCGIVSTRAAALNLYAPASTDMIRVSVSNAALPSDLAAMAAFLTEPRNIVLLGRSGKADKITLLAYETQNDVLFLKLRDLGPQPVPDTNPIFWRAYFVVAGHLISLSQTSFERAAPDDAATRALFAGFATATLAANPETGAR